MAQIPSASESQASPANLLQAQPPPAQFPEASFQYFYQQLSPYGTWVQIAWYGWAWSPAVAVSDPDWRPYADQGQWIYTDAGLYWQSAYPWGEIVFHYGRWLYAGGYGWLWVPAYDWAPAWVAWRHAEFDRFAGWAPLPPEAEFVAGYGLRYRGVFASDIDFGLAPEAFVFVGYDHLWDGDYPAFYCPPDRFGSVFGRSVIRNGYRFESGRFIVDGIGRERLNAFTHRDVRAVDARDLWVREEAAHIAVRRDDPAAHRGTGPDMRIPGSRIQAQHRPGTSSARPGDEVTPVDRLPTKAPAKDVPDSDKKKAPAER